MSDRRPVTYAVAGQRDRNSGAKKGSQSQKIARTAPKNFKPEQFEEVTGHHPAKLRKAPDTFNFFQARKRHININFFVRLVPVFTGFVPGTNPVCPWDKSGEKQGQTQKFSLFYTVEARFHRVCPWDKPGLSQGQSRGRRAAQNVYVKKVYVPFSLAIKF